MGNVGKGAILRQGLLALVLTSGIAISSVSMLAQPATPSTLSGEITSGGSSTVGLLTQAVAEEFTAQAPEVQTSVDISGTGGGFKQFCSRKIDIWNASRPITDVERMICTENGVDWYQFEVAYDGITVVINKENTWLSCVSTALLKKLWQKENLVDTWADLSPEFPAEAIALYGPGTQSGTFDFFVKTILNGDEIRQDFTPSEDDNVLVEGVAGDFNALGYFGLAYYQANQAVLNTVAIDAGDGNCVTPSPETVQDGTYQPLSRPLFIYVRADSLQRPEVQEFTRVYLSEARTIATDVGYVASPDRTYTRNMERFEDAIAGQGTPDSAIAASTPVS